VQPWPGHHIPVSIAGEVLVDVTEAVEQVTRQV